MNFFMNLIFLVVIFLSFVFGGIYSGTYNHELVHQQIMVDDGCHNAKINMWSSRAYTVCIDESYNESMVARLLHSENDIKEYNESVFVWFGVGVLFFLLWLCLNKVVEDEIK